MRKSYIAYVFLFIFSSSLYANNEDFFKKRCEENPSNSKDCEIYKFYKSGKFEKIFEDASSQKRNK